MLARWVKQLTKVAFHGPEGYSLILALWGADVEKLVEAVSGSLGGR